ncbi:PKD domain-containing protein [Leifsonia flava]|uniref:PKD domain-containing protein n=1 Tax=Orlajensenia leifsoniae TaxID=2561933 RepID=A0A4Y9R6L1_9MICO|nr:PKD domain-containing protein [Leifsonia flava]TFW00235.1 PKD domain-containing protein [Leifsonia flava]
MRVFARSRVLSIATVLAVTAGLVLVAQPAVADTAPPITGTPETVSSDALPTVQIDGVVWDQEVAGNKVFAGGEFGTARPAGADPGVNTVVRNNILSYNLTTGVLDATWAPNANARVRNLAVSPDGKRLYAVGSFTSIAGATRYRIAAFDTATGALISTFKPVINGKINAVAVTNSTVYVVGQFTTANNVAVAGGAALDAATGATKTGWAPQIANGQATSIVVKSDGSKVVIGGYFQSVNGSSSPGYGLASLDGTTAAIQPFNVNNSVRNADANAAISSLASDEGGVYGTGQHYGSGTLEGTFYASWDTGDIIWVEDCHGDTYSVYPVGDVIYTTSHAHYCGNIGAFPQTEPWTMHRALAFTKTVQGTITNDPHGYTNWAGTPRPALLDWFPDINTGSFTGVGQGGWSVSASGDQKYVLYGGEFTRVNNTKQQGLVRFAAKTVAPNKDAPRLSGANYVPNVVSFATGTARIAWPANWDRDNASLKYDVIRNGVTAAPVYTTTVNSNFYTLPTMKFVDTGLTPGATYTYRIRVTDPFGNVVNGNNVSVVVASSGSISDYATDVLDDNPTDYWRLGETSGPTAYDWAGSQDATASSGVTFGAAGAIGSDSNTAATFSGDSSGLVSTQSAIEGPNSFAIETWFKTTSTSGGKIVGFGNSSTGTSTNYDRHVYMDNAGRVLFGVHPGTSRVVQSGTGYNDGQWHHVVANLGPSGMQLYVDDVRVGQRSDTTYGQAYSGFWRIGGDSSWSGANFFQGTIDDVAIYPAPLSLQQVDSHWVKSGRTSSIPAAPADSYGARVFNDSPDLYWRLNEGVGAGTANDSGTSDNDGSYTGGVTKGITGAISGTTNKAASFNGSNGLVASNAVFSNPKNYTEELWFNTTTNSGGKLIGFGSSNTGTSGSYDRHVYMQDDGKLVFGVWTGFTNTITTPGAYNDGLWHHMVATQSTTSGMALYVDGALIGTNGQTDAQAYDGYWRIGGDNTWGSSSPFINARIDEAAVYSTVLSSTDVAAHYALGTGVTPNAAPTASFTSTSGVLTADVDGSASADSDGTISSYSWSFGDGGTATGPTATHAYTAGGTYTVTLTVTDNQGATATTSSSVVVASPPPNVPPAASFTTAVTNLDVSVDASASTDSDGSITGYAWTFGDGATASTPTASHSYAAAGTYTIGLTVTDDDGATTTTTSGVTVAPAPPANVAPTAAFTSSATFLSLSVDGGTSTDSDGTIASYAWNFGDGATATTPTATHPYAAAGTYNVSLTVTDDDGATNTTTTAVTVSAPPPNALPTASFTTQVDSLHLAVNGTASSDTDGTITSYAWNFGDGGTATGSTATHDYAAAGTYTVTLTVTDNASGTGTTSSSVTTVAPPGPAVYAKDAFGRTTSNGLGTADVGGAWTVSGGTANFSVGSGTANLKAPLGGTLTGYLNGVSTTDSEVRAQVSIDKVPTGTGTYASVYGRTVGTGTYGAKLRFFPTGAVTLQASGGSAIVLPGLSYTPGEQLQVRVQVTGTSPTTTRAKVWRVGELEPTTWQVSGTDSTAAMQVAGGVAIQVFLPSSATNAPVTGRFDNLFATASQ